MHMDVAITDSFSQIRSLCILYEYSNESDSHI